MTEKTETPSLDDIAADIGSQATKPSDDNVTMPEAPEPKKKRGRPKGSTNAKKTSTKAQQKSNEFVAMQMNGSLNLVLGLTFGEEIIPPEPQQEALNKTLADYLDTKPDFDLPPGIALATAYIAVYAPRFAQPTVKEKSTVVFLKFRGAFSGMKKLFSKMFKKGQKS